MQGAQSREVRTGSDPRNLPDFTALREEMGKLTHPARPDVDWAQVEKLSLSLFESNGVELQTCAWYTLARSHLARVSGLNEGLAILTALLSHQWAQLWPQPVHARAEIINGLLQRLQKLFRTFSLGAADVPALVLAETRLLEIKDILRRQELSHACQVNPLMQLIRSALSRLENSPQPEDETVEAGAPEQGVVITEDVPASRLVYVIRKAPEPDIQVAEEQPVPPKHWPIFLAGMLCAVLLCGVVVSGWRYTHRPDPTVQALTAMLSPIPAPLSTRQLDELRGSETLEKHNSLWLISTATQLKSLATLPPGWNLRYGEQLLAQSEALWPGNPQVEQMREKWQQQLAVNTLPTAALTGWHDGMAQLQQLTDRLNGLDRQKGKYITVSELKSQVFSMQQAFGKAVPIEEQLRLLRLEQSDNAALQQQVAQHIRQVEATYSTTLRQPR